MACLPPPRLADDQKTLYQLAMAWRLICTTSSLSIPHCGDPSGSSLRGLQSVSRVGLVPNSNRKPKSMLEGSRSEKA